MSTEQNRKRNLSSTDDKNTSKRRSICEEKEECKLPQSNIDVTTMDDEASQNSQSHDKPCDKKSRSGPIGSVSDSVFCEGSVLQSVSVNEQLESDDDPLQEYETQYFGFIPKSMMNGVYNALAEYIRESLAAITDYMKKQYPDAMTDSQLEQSQQKMISHVIKKLDRSFDVLEQYLMTNVFKIPDHVVLPNDQCQIDSPYTTDDEKQLDQEIKELEEKILIIRYANGVLRQDMIEMDEVQLTFDKSLKQLVALEELSTNCGVTDIKESTAYAINQVKQIITIVQTIENIER